MNLQVEFGISLMDCNGPGSLGTMFTRIQLGWRWNMTDVLLKTMDEHPGDHGSLRWKRGSMPEVHSVHVGHDARMWQI